MNKCPPVRATELTDLLLDCCSRVLTVIQTQANGEETAISVDLSCVTDNVREITDATFDCETGILSIILEDRGDDPNCDTSEIINVDLSCIQDTYVTWNDNFNGSVTLISADGTETIGVMRDCAGIDEIVDPVPEDLVVMCRPDGSTVKSTIINVTDVILEIIGDSKASWVDGTGTKLTGLGSAASPYRIDLAVCESQEVAYDGAASLSMCLRGDTQRMPAIKAGDNVEIGVDGTLNVSIPAGSVTGGLHMWSNPIQVWKALVDTDDPDPIFTVNTSGLVDPSLADYLLFRIDLEVLVNVTNGVDSYGGIMAVGNYELAANVVTTVDDLRTYNSVVVAAHVLNTADGKIQFRLVLDNGLYGGQALVETEGTLIGAFYNVH